MPATIATVPQGPLYDNAEQRRTSCRPSRTRPSEKRRGRTPLLHAVTGVHPETEVVRSQCSNCKKRERAGHLCHFPSCFQAGHLYVVHGLLHRHHRTVDLVMLMCLTMGRSGVVVLESRNHPLLHVVRERVFDPVFLNSDRCI